MLVALFLIRDLTSESFPPESNREFLWIKSNRKSWVFKSNLCPVKSNPGSC